MARVILGILGKEAQVYGIASRTQADLADYQPMAFAPGIPLCHRSGGELRTDVERLARPAFQRRALVLAASELVVNALSHAFGSRRQGRHVVSFRMVSRRRARLVVADDGAGCLGEA